AIPASVREGKEVLPVAARALGLTIQPWEVRAADDIERVFAAISKQRPDGLYVSAGPQMRTSEKQIVGFALKSRLSSVCAEGQVVDAGGCLYYGAGQAESYRRVAYFLGRVL